MPFGDDPFTAQLRAAQSMPAMQQSAGYPYQPYQQVAPGFGGYTKGHVAADLIGGVMNAWIGRQVNKQQEMQQRAQSVFNLTKLGYDLGDLLEDSQNRSAVEKMLNIKLPKNLETGGFGPRKSSAQMQEEATRDFLRKNAGAAPQVMSQMNAQAAQQPNWMPPQQATTAAQFYGQQLPSPVSADIYQQQPTPASPGAPPARSQQAGIPPWAAAIGINDPGMVKVIQANPELATRLGATAMTAGAGLEEARMRAGTAMAVSQMEQTQRGAEFLANMRMKGIGELGLVKEAADELAVSLVNPNVKLSTDTQKAIDRTLSTQQRQTQEQMINWMKDAFPSMNPDQAAGISTAIAKGFEIRPEWFAGFENQYAKLKALELTQKEVLAQKGTWDVKEKATLNLDGKDVTLPVYLAEKYMTLSKAGADYKRVREDIPNIDAWVLALKSDVTIGKPAKRAILKNILERGGFVTTDEKRFNGLLDFLGEWGPSPTIGVQEKTPPTAAPADKAKKVLDQLTRPSPLPAH